MFLKTKTPSAPAAGSKKKEAIPTLLTRDLHILGNLVSDGIIDIDGTVDGNIRCFTLTLRANGVIQGEVIADTACIYGKIRGTIRARCVNLYASCHIEGIIMHESLSIEDGAFIDGKCKRTDKPHAAEDEDAFFENGDFGDVKPLENIRLIR